MNLDTFLETVGAMLAFTVALALILALTAYCALVVWGGLPVGTIPGL